MPVQMMRAEEQKIEAEDANNDQILDEIENELLQFGELEENEPLALEHIEYVPENEFIGTVGMDQDRYVESGSEFSDDSFDEQDFEEHEPVDAKCSTSLVCASRKLIQKDQKEVKFRNLVV